MPDFTSNLSDRSSLFPRLGRLTLLAGWLAAVSAAPCFADDPGNLLTGADFSRQLNRPLLANRDYSPFREVLNRLSAESRIKVCLDRRIDPEKLVLVDIQAPYFDTGIGSLAERVGAKVVVLADTVFVTTPETADTLRTRVALAERKLEELKGISIQRKLELSRKMALNWDDLATPRNQLQDFARRFHVRIENPDVIPHDLWGAGGVAYASFVQGSMLIAAQYHYEIQWVDAQAIRLVPESAHPVIEQDHLFRGRDQNEATGLVRDAFPDLKLQVKSGRIRFAGLLEQHEAVATLLGNRAARKATVSVVATSLANRRFTLRMMNRPFNELIAVLEKQGIQFDRNQQQLEAQGIDLNQRISLELENATIEKLLSDACTPLGLAYQINGTRIELGLAPRPVPFE